MYNYNEYESLRKDYRHDLIKKLDGWANEVWPNIDTLIEDYKYSDKIASRLLENIHRDLVFFQPYEYPLLYAILQHLDNIIRGYADSRSEWCVILKLINEAKYEVYYVLDNDEEIEMERKAFGLPHTIQESAMYSQENGKDSDEWLNRYLGHCAETIKELGLTMVMAHPRIANAVADLLLAPFNGYNPSLEAEYLPIANIVYQYATRLKATPDDSRLWQGIIAAIEILQRNDTETITRLS